MSKVDALINADKEQKPQYDFDFITRSLGLIPICNSDRAFNPGAITFMRPRQSATNENVCYVEIGLHSGESFMLSPEEMAELEATIKRRASEAKELQKEAFKSQLLAQAEAASEIQRGIQGAMLVGGPGKRKL